MKKMVLNDLTLEKLVSEINGYKEKMRNIYEEYGRASQDLQDRINVLGYTLNEHLKETKDQIGNTPQRLLNLETKYVTGEVSEQEYRGQRIRQAPGLLPVPSPPGDHGLHPRHLHRPKPPMHQSAPPSRHRPQSPRRSKNKLYRYHRLPLIASSPSLLAH